MLRLLMTMMMAGTLVLAACSARNDSGVAVTTEMGTEGELVADTTAAVRDSILPVWGFGLNPTSAEFDVAGEGRVQALPDSRTRVAVEIRGADSGASHPWHVHEGSCGSGGPIVGDPAAYPVLTVGAGNEASADATIDVALDPSEDYYVNIHQSTSDTETIVSCGEVTGTF